jgi:V/A-type H+-transporting ATPase subunit K
MMLESVLALLKGFNWDMLGIPIGMFGAALAVGLPCSGSAIGVGRVGEAGSGLLTVEPSKFSRILIFQILPGTQGLYGLVVWFLALMKLGFFTGVFVPLSLTEGIKFFAACMPVAFGGFIFGGTQGRICSNGLSIVAKNQRDLSKSIILAIMMEFYSILAFLATFLMLNSF